MTTYLPRVADLELAGRLAAMGAVLIEGPKACGKTATAVQVAATTFRFDEDANARAAVTLNPVAPSPSPPPSRSTSGRSNQPSGTASAGRSMTEVNEDCSS